MTTSTRGGAQDGAGDGDARLPARRADPELRLAQLSDRDRTTLARILARLADEG